MHKITPQNAFKTTAAFYSPLLLNRQNCFARFQFVRNLSCDNCSSCKSSVSKFEAKLEGLAPTRVRKTVTKEFKDLASAKKEASRCLQCIEKPCSKACPADTKPDKFIRQLYFDNPEGGAETILNNNAFGGVCGVVCPVSKLCEEACTRAKVDRPIEIGALQNFLHRWGVEKKIRPPTSKSEKSDKKIAVVGSGPCGISAARDLQRLGADVTVFEAQSDAGGALRYFLSPVRMDHLLVKEEVKRVESLGVKIVTNHKISNIDDLKDSFDYVYVAPGLQEGALLTDIAISQAWTAIEVLTSANTDRQLTNKIVRGKRIIVVGSGSVAMDVAVTCAWLGTANINVISTESLADLKADKAEIELARKYNVSFLPERKVIQFDGTHAKVQHTSIQSEIDVLRIDTLIMAIGQRLDKVSLNLLHEAEQSSRVSVGGDALHTGGTVVQAVADGKKAALNIARQLHLIQDKDIQDINEIIPTYKYDVSLDVEFCGVKFPNPFCLSSSPVSNTGEMCARAFDAGWGGVYYKTLNLDDQFKILHPSPRLAAVHSTPAGERIGVGIQNVEQISDRPLIDNLKDIEWLKKNYPSNVVGVSIMGYRDEDWKILARSAELAGADILELNFSCPQMVRADAGHHVGQQFDLIERYTRVAKSSCNIPVIAKMTPNITDMVPAALSAQRGGADGISAINTLKSISHVDLDYSACDGQIYKPQPSICGDSSISGFSGNAGRPIALRFIAEMAQDSRLHIPISGMGGIYTWHDAVEFLCLGASNLQATTSVMRHGYGIVEDLKDGLKRHLRKVGASSLEDIIGKGLVHIKEPSQLNMSTESVSFVNSDKCIGCGACVTSCSDAGAQAIQLVHGVAQVDQQLCIGCNLCESVCPVPEAIHMSIRQRISRPYL